MATMTRRARTSAILMLALSASLLVSGGVAAPSSTRSPGPVLIDAAGRGNPYINFEDGRAIPVVSPEGGGLVALLSDASRGLALASADFDEDGMADLVASYEGDSGGLLSLHFGNVDAVRPHAPEAKARRAAGTFVDSPFLPEATFFATPERPDFLATGDFDADGHNDILTASAGGWALALHRGDGTGGFRPPESFPLPGAVTALTTGEINRRDGLTDLVVGIVADEGAQALVFQASEGALAAPPQVVGLPAAAADFALGQMDALYPFDLAVVAGNHLVRVPGTDRALDPGARLIGESTPLPVPPAALALGDFDADGAPDLALLDDSGGLRFGPAGDPAALAAAEAIPLSIAGRGAGGRPRLMRARVSSLPGDDLVAVSRNGTRLTVAHPGRRGHPATSFTMRQEIAATAAMRLNFDALEDLVILSREKPASIITLPTAPLNTYLVTDASDSGLNSLRTAILLANGNAGADLILIKIPGIGPHVLAPLTPLPVVSDPVTIDATSDPDYVSSPLFQLDGISLGAADGLNLTAGSSTIGGLSIVRFSGSGTGPTGGNGVRIDIAGSNVIQDNYLGFPVVSIGSPGNDNNGVLIDNAANNQVLRNVFTFNGIGILIRGTGAGTTSGARMNLVLGNQIGTNPAGTIARPNFDGVVLEHAPDNTVGGVAVADRNLISGQVLRGVGIIRSNSTGNLIQNNYIGTNAAGTAAIANQQHGIFVDEGSGNTIGGTTAASLNLVSGNSVDGIHITDLLAAANLVQGNRIGTNAAGTAAIGNARHGVYVLSAPDNFVGGGLGAGNLISGNGGNGVFIDGANATGNRVQGSSIGTNAAGTAAIANALHGVMISNEAASNLIGNALTPTRRNRIGFNGMTGVFVEEGAANSVRANAIFSNATLGIDLAPVGGTINDPLDPDAGPNRLQNYPDITRARTTGGEIYLDATLNSEPGQIYEVEFFASPACDATGRGEGARYLGLDASTIADSAGNSLLDRTFIVAVADGEAITATATHPDGATSEFSLCFTATPAPVIVPRSASIPLSGLEVFWQAVSGALSYNLYRGTAADLPNLVPPPSLAPPTNSCLRWSGTTTSTGQILDDVPPLGEFYWYLPTGVGVYGESDGGEGSLGPRKLNPSGPCVDASCSHDKCIEGVALEPSCGACVAQICAADSFCCDTQWDNFCVEEARTICGSFTCQESKGQCNHPLCSFGPALSPGCDVPPLPQASCVAQICATDPFCCEDHWDELCIDEVATVCGLNCQ